MRRDEPNSPPELPTPERETRTLVAANALLASIVKIAGSVAGLTVVVLLVGWRYTEQYYATLGAPWFAQTLPVVRLGHGGASLLALTIYIAALAIYLVADGPFNARRLQIGSVVISIVGFVCLGIAATRTPDVAAGVLAGVGMIMVNVSTGLAIAELVSRLADSQLRWSAGMLYTMVTVFYFGLYLAPGLAATVSASTHLASISKAYPKATLVGETAVGRTWYMVSMVDAGYLLISPSGDGQNTAFRVVPFTEVAALHRP